MTTVDFERRAMKVLRGIRGSSSHRVEVGPELVKTTCTIDGRAYELSTVVRTEKDRDRAFEFVLGGLETTRRTRAQPVG